MSPKALIVIVIPAADVRGGGCVRLLRGDFTHETVYAEEPSRSSSSSSARAPSGCTSSTSTPPAACPTSSHATPPAPRSMTLRETDATVEFGGGVRSPEAARAWLELGADLVVLGSLAVRRPEVAAEICRGPSRAGAARPRRPRRRRPGPGLDRGRRRRAGPPAPLERLGGRGGGAHQRRPRRRPDRSRPRGAGGVHRRLRRPGDRLRRGVVARGPHRPRRHRRHRGDRRPGALRGALRPQRRAAALPCPPRAQRHA